MISNSTFNKLFGNYISYDLIYLNLLLDEVADGNQKSLVIDLQMIVVGVVIDQC